MNTLTLVTFPPTESGPRHGGAVMQRKAILLVNGHLHESYTEGSASINYVNGAYYDKFLESKVAYYETILGCKCVKARKK